jgi:adenosylcobyric acid synthase
MGSTGGAVLVCGTASGVGKSLVVTGLCRLLARRGSSTAPFKAQNMSNQSAVTAAGGEIGRAQYAQALAAGAEPEVAMNPVLLKPEGDATCQVVVLGRAVGRTTAATFGDRTPALFDVVLRALRDLRARFDVVVAEGAGGAAEVNLLDRDLVNLPLADAAGLSTVLVVDVDRGGAFASAFGTLALLPPHLRRWVQGIVVNKFRGDVRVLEPGLRDLESRTGVPVLGVLPSLDGVMIDEEDSLGFDTWRDDEATDAAVLDVAVVRFPRLANATDLDPLRLDPRVAVRFVTHAAQLGRPHLVVLPGTKATVDDLAWLRARGLVAAIEASRATVLGICGGYQMLGRRIHDDVESQAGAVAGLDRLAVTTTFAEDKVVRRVRGEALGEPVEGYEIHHGRTTGGEGAAWISLDVGAGGSARSEDGRWWGTSVHGLFENDSFRATFLDRVADAHNVALAPSGWSFALARAAHHDRLADLLETHLDVGAVLRLVGAGATRP